MTNIELVAQGLGLGVVPSTAVEAALVQRRVSRLSVTPAMATNPVALMWRAGPRDLRVEMLRACLQ